MWILGHRKVFLLNDSHLDIKKKKDLIGACGLIHNGSL